MAEWKDTDKEKLTITTDLTGCDLVDLAYLRAKDLPNERLANIVDWLVSERTNSETFFWLARINNEPVGYAYAEEESGAVESKKIYVLPERRNKGIGKEIKKAQIKSAGQKGYHKITTLIPAENDASLSVSRACGFMLSSFGSNHYNAVLYV